MFLVANKAVSTMDTYKVVFWGETFPGKNREAAMMAFADRFGVRNGSQLKNLFSGKVNILKQGLDKTYAKRLAMAIEEIGCRSRIETDRTDKRLQYETNDDLVLESRLPDTYPSGLAQKLEQAQLLEPRMLAINLVPKPRSAFQ